MRNSRLHKGKNLAKSLGVINLSKVSLPTCAIQPAIDFSANSNL
jgi:hypothetical protein